MKSLIPPIPYQVMISIKNSSSLVDVEDENHSLDTENEISLKLPTSLKHGGGFGITAALIQLIAKFSRMNTDSKLSMHAASANEQGLHTLAQEPYGMTALYFIPTISLGPDSNLASRSALEHAVPRIRAMQEGNFLDSMHGRGAFLSCFAGAKNEFLLPFYSRGTRDSLRGREEFSRLTEQLIDACAPTALRQLPSRHIKALSLLVYELFRNTDEHAQDDVNGIPYRRNARGILVKHITYSGESLSANATGQDINQNMFMLRTLSNQKRHTDTDGNVRSASDVTLIELTVFDTGPGLAKRWLSKTKPDLEMKDLSVEEEVALVKACFTQHATTKDNYESGHGLDLVVNCLHELNAFLRLRTGRVCLVQDFSATSTSNFSPRHWLKERPLLSAVPGAAYSIVIPLSRGKN
ncbi:hypothetical protein [Herminiimonas aquatilis]|uniref:Histidine kinase/DNA gyrase B/HSP90-like ATPase n=1 Tax=Herminiimonas aquatilis TaxID=345342 RepID=A0ABW2J4P2_9BURK